MATWQLIGDLIRNEHVYIQWSGHLFETFRQVDRKAEDGRIHSFRRTNGSQDDGSGVKTDADSHGVVTWAISVLVD